MEEWSDAGSGLKEKSFQLLPLGENAGALSAKESLRWPNAPGDISGVITSRILSSRMLSLLSSSTSVDLEESVGTRDWCCLV